MMQDEVPDAEAGPSDPSEQELRQRKGNRASTKMDRKHMERLYSLLKEEEEEDELAVDSLNTREAMAVLVKHLEIDPDGGITNLSNESNDVQNANQRSKLDWLRKSKFEVMLACLQVVRLIMNPTLCIFFSVRIIKGVALNEDFGVAFREHCRQLRIPMMVEMVIFHNIIELTGITLLLIRAVRNIFRARYHKPPAASDTFVSASEDATDSRFAFIAKFFWQDVPHLQTFSGLKGMSLVHPDLVTKFVQEYNVGHEIAHAILVRFLRVDAEKYETAIDEDIVLKVAKLIVRYDHKNMDEKEQQKLALQYLMYPPEQALKLLYGSQAVKDRAYIEENCKYDLSALGSMSRFYAIMLGQFIFFSTLIALITMVGMMAYLDKITHLVWILQDPARWETSGLVYFAQFVSQATGCHAINWLLRWRIETFIFGGVDARVSTEERFVVQVYFTHLAEKIWLNNAIGFWEKVAIFMQLDDDDLQQLIVEEDNREKHKVISKVRRYMKAHGMDSATTRLALRFVGGSAPPKAVTPQAPETREGGLGQTPGV